MAFMIDRSLFDRAFAPASLENDDVDLTLIKLAQNFRNLENESVKDQRITQLSKLFTFTNTKYLILDQTVSTTNLEDEIKLWGEFMQEDYNNLVTNAVKSGILQQVNNYTVDNVGSDNTIVFYEVVSPTLDIKLLHRFNQSLMTKTIHSQLRLN
jgi:hypothetical protein